MVQRHLEEPLATVASEALTAAADLIFLELRNKSTNSCIKFYCCKDFIFIMLISTAYSVKVYRKIGNAYNILIKLHLLHREVVFSIYHLPTGVSDNGEDNWS